MAFGGGPPEIGGGMLLQRGGGGDGYRAIWMFPGPRFAFVKEPFLDRAFGCIGAPTRTEVRGTHRRFRF